MSDPNAALTAAGFRAGLDACIRCGLCLPACPTYEVSRTEMEGPRGRIALMRAAADGRVGVGGAFREHLDSCLGCRSCETACPSGVGYGDLLEQAREATLSERPRSRTEDFARWLGLRQLLPHRRRLRLLATLARAARATGLIRLAEMDAAPDWLRRPVALLPAFDGERGEPSTDRPAPAIGEQRGTVALFRGCVQDAFLPAVNAATVRVLQRNGYEVHFPAGETCCGAAALHMGEKELARELARHNLEAFESSGERPPGGGRTQRPPGGGRTQRPPGGGQAIRPPGGGQAIHYDAIVSNAGGCGAMLKEYPRLLAEVGRRTRAFAGKVYDVSEFLADRLHVPPDTAIAGRATYADSCHLRHAQKVASAPRELLRRIPGLEVVELARPDFCCGSAGVYNLLRPDDADRVLEVKMEDVRATGADLIVTTNPGCQLQLAAGVRRAGLNARVVHLVELLDRAYGRPGGAQTEPGAPAQ